MYQPPSFSALFDYSVYFRRRSSANLPDFDQECARVRGGGDARPWGRSKNLYYPAKKAGDSHDFIVLFSSDRTCSIYINNLIIPSTKSYKHFPQSYPQGFSPVFQWLGLIINSLWKTRKPQFSPIADPLLVDITTFPA